MDGSPFTTVGKREPAGKGSDSKGGATRGASGDEDNASRVLTKDNPILETPDSLHGKFFAGLKEGRTLWDDCNLLIKESLTATEDEESPQLKLAEKGAFSKEDLDSGETFMVVDYSKIQPCTMHVLTNVGAHNGPRPNPCPIPQGSVNMGLEIQAQSSNLVHPSGHFAMVKGSVRTWKRKARSTSEGGY
jgi:hypothetical protein